MNQQKHLFRDDDDKGFLVTMEDVIEAGIPIDADSGDDMEYMGPVIKTWTDKGCFHHIVQNDGYDEQFLVLEKNGEVISWQAHH